MKLVPPRNYYPPFWTNTGLKSSNLNLPKNIGSQWKEQWKETKYILDYAKLPVGMMVFFLFPHIIERLPQAQENRKQLSKSLKLIQSLLEIEDSESLRKLCVLFSNVSTQTSTIEPITDVKKLVKI
jgi:hypothetical protein